MNKVELQNRTKEFARRCLKLCQALPENWVGKHLRNQLFRSATSVAANYRSACSAQSIKAFLQKLGIVVEEIDESMFWIEFIAEQELVGNKRCQPFLSHRRKRRVEKMEN